jgi:hypothetical protein
LAKSHCKAVIRNTLVEEVNQDYGAIDDSEEEKKEEVEPGVA